MESHGVNSNISDTFQKFKAERECYNSSLTSVAQPRPSGAKDREAAHWVSRKHHAVFISENDGGCFVAIERPSLRMSRRFTDTTPKQRASYTVVSLWPYI